MQQRLNVGDMVTFTGRPRWWKRMLIRLGLMKKPKKMTGLFVLTQIEPRRKFR
jgi:hypothetical protein